MIKHPRTHSTSATRSKQSAPMKSNLSQQERGDNLRGNIWSNIHSSMEKYTALARDAMISGDRVLAESFYQQAEHYLRLNNEFKENIVVLPNNESTLPAQEHPVTSNDFEMSIEQELATAQSGL